MEPSPSLDTLSDDLHSISSNSTTTPTTSTSSSATTTTTKHTHTPSTQTLTLQDIHFLKKLGSGDIGSVYQAILTKPQFVSTLHFQCHDYISRSTKNWLEGNLDVPRTWLASQEIIRFRYLKDSEVESEASVNPGNAITYVDNSKGDQEAVKMLQGVTRMVKIYYEGTQRSKQGRPGEDVAGNSSGTAWIKEPQAFAKMSVEIEEMLDGTPRKKSRTARDDVKMEGNKNKRRNSRNFCGGTTQREETRLVRVRVNRLLWIRFAR
ncbi:hypothetical protein Tco_0679524 [Tanacetum coccineum]|uniref:Uncharacterized protein n=1 Tax=Tanacetum coccineum TaxID=301880 RepID=A0ABQ4XJB4_9ASTR